ncbi:plasmid replication DNA-binding protein (plasmid) [Acinetobacter sp. ANC 7201]|uniref:plasmid replication DNA-binding protein n=1 Tax=Acinetobacter TaxID=469 RepID=UPI0024786CA7|nr:MULTISPECIES: plasmid replication DNA-binding protein [Acinetobacter]MDY6458081.1 plasmid replication DNA-binding protein [Acinetobacter faecalis]WFP98129.1 plasmid replication DNA-binding protein [Acinetobacter sp. ANC 7201]
MKSLSVIELSNLYGMTRQAVYKHINKGNLSKNSEGRIDLSEAIRVFGEPSRNVNSSQTTETRKLSEVHLLEQQVYMLQKQLEQAHEREQFQREELKAKNDQLHVKDEQIEAIQRLLEAPKVYNSNDQKLDIATNKRSKSESNYEGLTTDQETKKRIPVPQHVVPETKKRGFLSRFFLPNG